MTCPDCGRTVRWVQDAHGSLIPLDTTDVQTRYVVDGGTGRAMPTYTDHRARCAGRAARRSEVIAMVARGE